ncbi:uncharacterized protein M421DRAFT_70600 [Didymella exigua CBS 183.55]|uniref:DUF829-domain-containing protein n=1 Tax=Didymella exigua CBS 183.55 TaxID=1150837 RepID=A0A6A5RDS2_9PLEO|nr:uncharacterized protein M421DRAFT_70600 [Didymella exigua CBS 183.55]KAF1925254.1 hypothetical protein M421DRAFT_70600 [Didymella exigua CBS 183.55]
MVSTKVAHDAIPGFELIAPTIWDRIPSTPSTPTVGISAAPSLVLLMTWAGAHGRPISKYTTEYANMFPSSHIMVVTTSLADLLFRSSKRKQHRPQPAVKYISNLQHIPCANTSGILMHVFSEGGSNKACELATAYQCTTGSRLPISALYLDSTPGHRRFPRLCAALAKPLPPVPVLKHLALGVAAVLLGSVWAVHRVFQGRKNNVVSRSRAQLLDPTLFDLQVPPCYLFSKKDALIAWQDVEEHAAESMQQGACVAEVLFEASGHVDHARAEPARYRAAVTAVWRQSQERGNRNKNGYGEKGARAPCESQSQLSKLDFDDFEAVAHTLCKPSRAHLEKHRWSNGAGSALTLLPSLPPTPTAEKKMLAMEQRPYCD